MTYDLRALLYRKLHTLEKPVSLVFRSEKPHSGSHGFTWVDPLFVWVFVMCVVENVGPGHRMSGAIAGRHGGPTTTLCCGQKHYFSFNVGIVSGLPAGRRRLFGSCGRVLRRAQLIVQPGW